MTACHDIAHARARRELRRIGRPLGYAAIAVQGIITPGGGLRQDVYQVTYACRGCGDRLYVIRPAPVAASAAP